MATSANSHQTKKGRETSARLSLTQQSNGTDSVMNSSSGAGDGEEMQEPQDEDNADQADKSAVQVRGSVPLKKLKAVRPTLERKTSKLQDAVNHRMSQLQASGWRPEEEAFTGAEEDDDDGYNAVDLISDSDEEDLKMRQTEEDALMEERTMNKEEEDALVRRLSLSSHGSDGMDGDDITGQELLASLMGQSTSFEEMLGLVSAAPDAENDAVLGEAFEPSQRRVRFKDELDGSDAGSTDTDAVNETFPDLFMQQDQLGHSLQQMVEDDTYLDDASDAGSYWDFDGDDMEVDFDDDDEGSYESDDSASGYQSDDGDTTDEEVPPHPSSIKRPSSDERPSTADSVSSTGTPSGTANESSRKKAKSRRASSPRLPAAGLFMLDPRRPVLLVSGSGKTQRNVYHPAKIQTPEERRFWQRLHSIYNNRNTSPRTSVQLTPEEEAALTVANTPPMDINTELGFFNMFGSLRSDDVMGPPEAFVPFTSVDAAGAVTDDASMQSESDDDDDDFMDLIDFGGESDDEDEDLPDESDANESSFRHSVSPFPVVTPKDSSRRGSHGDNLLAHLDRNRGLVGSFRRNQQHAMHVGSLPSHPTLRASMSETNAMQSGRRAAGNTPITPLRKKRGNKTVGHRNSPIISPPMRKVTKRKSPIKGTFGHR